MEIESGIEKEITTLLKKVDPILSRNFQEGDITGDIEGVLTHEDYGYKWDLEAEVELDTKNFLDTIDSNTELIIDELFWDLEEILPSEAPDYSWKLQSIIDQLGDVTENQVNIAINAHDNAQDTIDAIKDNQDLAVSDTLIDIDDTLGNIGDSIENSSKDSQDFIGACLEGIGSSLEDVGQVVFEGIEAGTKIIEPALNAIGTVYEYMLEKLLKLLRELFLLDPAQIKEYMSTFLDIFTSFTKSIG